MPLSPVASAHFSNLSPSSVTRNNFVPSPIYCSPSTNKTHRSKRNTVHWDKSIFDPSIKENAVPDGGRNSPSSSNASGSLRALDPSQEFHLDLCDRKFRGHQRRTPLDPETFIAPDTPVDSADSSPTNTDYYLHGLVKAARDLDPNENVFEKHRKKQFQWVLSLPASAASNCDQSLDSPLDYTASPFPSEGNRRYFGCNLLTWTKTAGKENQLPGDPEDKYLLLATPIDLKPDCSDTTNVEFTIHQEQFRVLQQDTQHLQMAATQVMGSPASATRNGFHTKGVTPQSAQSSQSAQSAMWSTATIADASEDSDNTLTLDSRREQRAPLSTIEDSLEELDQFEDEVEALAAATRMTHITDPQGKRPRAPEEKRMSSSKTATNTTPPADKFSPKAQGSTRSKTSEPSRSSSVHKHSPPTESDQDSEKMPVKASPTRKIARPASLAPPKPLQKANKPPTIPTFELPGERVARELKERKAARLSMQLLDAQKPAGASSPAPAPPPQRVRSIRSSKPPTVPNFELPGETYSRMAKERLAARLKAEEEEAVRRRQFKARPPPSSRVFTTTTTTTSSSSSAATVRSTFTSRQREAQAGQPEQGQGRGRGNSSPVSPSPKSSSGVAGKQKRQSVAMTMTMTPSSSSSLARTASAASASSVSTTAAQQRGRTSSVDSSQLSSTRATSSSNGSAVSGGGGGTTTKHHTSLTAEQEQQQQQQQQQRQKNAHSGRGNRGSIYLHDNSVGQDREREARERQQAVALARQKYAEQSRMLAASRRMKQQQQQQQQSSTCSTSPTTTTESRGGA
ncbi:hypothetical protein VMCG_05496 [Cytospora schulzeri]|uniref:Uncharacterized protein n=1 Tax=Cytospora schulzeri TaxID=448051 RepID=A0A423WK00_9PEZI|nr:hypothetical protein VMCG_05496 [Valsa malicola]